jgi:hypothetical protein
MVSGFAVETDMADLPVSEIATFKSSTEDQSTSLKASPAIERSGRNKG